MKPLFTIGTKMYLKVDEEPVIVVGHVWRGKSWTYLVTDRQGEAEVTEHELLESKTYSGND